MLLQLHKWHDRAISFFPKYSFAATRLMSVKLNYSKDLPMVEIS